MHSELYHRFNSGLLEMRETFHRTGRLDDSNTKLDEIVKLLCIEVSQLHGIPKGLPSLADTLDQYHFGKKKSLVAALNETLERVARSPLFRNADGESLLGNNPRLSIPETENGIAEQLASLVTSTFDASLHKSQTQENFQLLNQVFGHFIRDNSETTSKMRGTLTPPEVVTYMCRIGADELSSSARKSSREIIVADPSCGVGSFLAQCYAQFRRDDRFSRPSIMLVGQDKVDRMARLAKLNLLLFKTASAEIYRGNSLIGESPLDAYSSRCDLILTNPPFGARFPARELRQHGAKSIPFLV